MQIKGTKGWRKDKSKAYHKNCYGFRKYAGRNAARAKAQKAIVKEALKES